MEDTAYRAIAIVGVGAVLPDAPNAPAFWKNITGGRYSIRDVMPDRWNPELYFDPDPKVPDKTYSKIGGWVRDFSWDPLGWHLPVPPKVAAEMDEGQKWAVACTYEALTDYGWPNRKIDTERTAVILGNAMAGEKHYVTAARVFFPEFARELAQAPGFAALPPEVRNVILRQFHANCSEYFPPITEDTMPGELSNCIAGRIANLFNFHGPNFVCDAACASAMAAMSAAVEGLIERDFDMVVTGGVDRNMGIGSFVKFCKIGALSATGTRPYADGADGFVMGEGAALFLLKRLEDAERDGDKIYAVLRGVGGASDGRGKGITAPNPVGQKLAIERAWQNAALSPATATLIEGHGTSTKVGDVVEFQSLTDVFTPHHPALNSIALGSVKSNIGHLKGAAGAAGMLKAIFALKEKMLPPSLNFVRPNPNIDFANSPFFVNTELRPWETPGCGVRRAGVSAFGFGGTNFHMVLEEYIPGRLKAKQPPARSTEAVPAGGASDPTPKAPLRGALVVGAGTSKELAQRLDVIVDKAKKGNAPAVEAPLETDLRAPERIAIDYADAHDLAEKGTKALKALETENPAMWKALRGQGVHRGSGKPGKVAFLYTGQGSQYVNMLQHLREIEPLVAETFVDADKVMTPLLGKPLSSYIFVNGANKEAVEQADHDLRQTAITQPAVLAVDAALTKLMGAYGIKPEMVMGHSLGEYGALVAAGAMPFADALEAVSARGREMTRVSMADNGKMAAVIAPIEEIKETLKTIDGYVVIANLNSHNQVVIGGASEAVVQAEHIFKQAGHTVVPLPVSHAFHTSIVAPASEPLRQTLERLHLQSPDLPIVANATGEFYPTGPGVVPEMLDLLAKQVAAPVQFVKGLETLRQAGATVFVEMGPKKALQGFVEDVYGNDPEVIALASNHPKLGDVVSFNQALCGLYAAGLGTGRKAAAPKPVRVEEPVAVKAQAAVAAPVTPVAQLAQKPAAVAPSPAMPPQPKKNGQHMYNELGRLFAEFLERGMNIYTGGNHQGTAALEPVVITGAGLGLPGVERTFDDGNVGRILRGQQCIDVIPARFRRAMVEKHITRLVKSESGASFETIENAAEVIKLAARAGKMDLEHEFGVAADRIPALDEVTQLAIGAGIDALRDAGIPMVLRYKTTTKGTKLPDRWNLPEELRDDTGVIFASAFPGYDSFAQNLSSFWADHARHEALEKLTALRSRMNGFESITLEVDRQINELKAEIEKHPYLFDRRFLFRVLAMGHSQFAELIGARGPNTQVNSACASTTQATAIAQDWISTGRCRRVIIIAADDVTSDNLLEWFGSGFLASGAAATDDVVEEAATPFDRRRHGMILGMGAAAFVVESAEAARERGIRPICEVLSTMTANSAFHGTRLDVSHICQVMEKLVAKAEAHGYNRFEIAPQMVFVSHETYTPARGGSAAAEIHALREVFGPVASQIVIANTKGYTGHPMGVGIEDVVAIKALETGLVPPVPNFKEVDPDLGQLNLSRGGAYPVQFALRLGAGFGSQISMTLFRWVPNPDGRHRTPEELGFAYRVENPTTQAAWLSRVSGYPQAELEIHLRNLRVKDQGAPETKVQGSGFRVQGPTEIKAVQPVMAPMVASMAAPVLPAPLVTAPTPVPEKPVVAAPQVDPVQVKVMALAAEKTGYPPDMLDLDLDLEADLGIDTVKQAEMFAAVRDLFNIPRDENRKLRDYPTLRKVIEFVHQQRPDLKEGVQGSGSGVQGTEAIAPAVAAVPSVETDAVKEKILALAVEKTGYPADMLDLDLDLEADLGIDTVKQAEMFAAVRGLFDIPRDENRKLRDYPTLRHVIEFVYQQKPELKARVQGTEAMAPTVAAVPSVETDAVKEKILALAVEKTGYPADMLDLDLDLEADLGVDTVKQAEMFAAVRGLFDIPRDENRKLRDYPTLRHVIEFVYQQKPELKARVQGAEAMAPAVAAVPSVETDEVKEKILALAVEKTGYPADMLDLDLDLEADLGVDTVKQAEMFAAVRGLFDIPRDENRKLRDYPTLRHVIEFVYQQKPELKAGVQGSGSGVQGSEEKSEKAGLEVSATITGSMEAANAVPRRVPVPQLRPNLDWCKPTGVKLEAGTRVVLMPDNGFIAELLDERLKDLEVEVLWLENAMPAEAVQTQIAEWLAEGPIHGVYWLPALDSEGPLTEMDLETWRERVRERVKLLFTTMKALYEPISKPGTFLVTGVRLDGQHGYSPQGAQSPLGGSVTGFTKAYKRERADVLVKAIDFAPELDGAEIADLFISETGYDPGVVEVGYCNDLRWTVGLEEQPAVDGNPGMELNPETVFVVTGAAGSIVSAITADLAAASGGIFYLLDLIPEPDAANPDLQRLTSDKENLKRDIFERLKAKGERATPALVEKELAGLERSAAALAAIQAVQKAGGTVHYFSGDLRQPEAVNPVFDHIRAHSGRVDVLLHAAGLEISHFLTEKEAREFDLVFDVKCDGWFNLLKATGDLPLGATVVFSSIAGRFGNGGQTDYSSANDVLCKTTSSFRNSRPATRGIAIDWTAWGGIGMASRGSIPKMMELAGIDMLKPEAGIPIIRRELTAGGTRGEIVVAERLGLMLNEFDTEGGLDVHLVPVTEVGPMADTVISAGLYSGLMVEKRLDPMEQAFLYDHQIEGTPVLPGVMGMESFAEAASLLVPEWHVTAVENVDFLAPFKFYRQEPRTVRVVVQLYPDGKGLLAKCKLIGIRHLPNQAQDQETVHFTGQVRLAPKGLETPVSDPPAVSEHTVSAETIYQVYFHGPAYQVLEKVGKDRDGVAGRLAENLPLNHQPETLFTKTTPRLVELCFQTAGIWEIGNTGQMGLPLHVDRMVPYRNGETGENGLTAIVTRNEETNAFDARVCDGNGLVVVELCGYRTIQFTAPDAAHVEAVKTVLGS
ncbi:MAG: SDR family NAD(P)-dependent oxidoreductase [Blastocatellia bacterium]|nr:SDR family NAD(P)-dependent oxidoreductase [Blastocatellia bacterium]